MNPNQNSIVCTSAIIKIDGTGLTEFRHNLKLLCMVCRVTDKELAVPIICVNNVPHPIQHRSIWKSILHHHDIQKSAYKITKSTWQPNTGADVSIWNGWRLDICLLFGLPVPLFPPGRAGSVVFLLSSPNFMTQLQHVPAWSFSWSTQNDSYDIL